MIWCIVSYYITNNNEYIDIIILFVCLPEPLFLPCLACAEPLERISLTHCLGWNTRTILNSGSNIILLNHRFCASKYTDTISVV